MYRSSRTIVGDCVIGEIRLGQRNSKVTICTNAVKKMLLANSRAKHSYCYGTIFSTARDVCVTSLLELMNDIKSNMHSGELIDHALARFKKLIKK